MREADCRLRAIPVFLQTMIEKRDSFACTISTFSQGLKPTGISNASRGAEAPLFHGSACVSRRHRVSFFVHTAFVFAGVGVDLDFWQVCAAERMIQGREICRTKSVPAFHYIRSIALDRCEGF